VRYRLLIAQLGISLIIVFCYSYLGLEKAFFWNYWWWDIPMHILGGVWAALLLAWTQTLRSKPYSLIAYVLMAFAIGGAWELLEYIGHFPRSQFMSYSLDTAKDLVMDALGGISTYYLVRFFRL